MHRHGPTPGRITTPSCCSRCSRCFVTFGKAAAEEILCVCGAPLEQRPLSHPFYQLLPLGDEPDPERPDVEFDASHRDPTEPGDAPVDVAESASAR